ncbi:MAG TPA: hypothetical protein VHO26_01645 [Propionibacteriaceae bacterium]|nr:hypothetical protein [Propionibacteriaceae bacterium]
MENEVRDTTTDGPAASGRGSDGRRRIGAYLLPGDPVWLASSLSRYYDLLDDLVVVVPDTGTGWTGRPLPVEECLEIIGRHDPRGLRRIVRGEWYDAEQPMHAETAQRQAGIAALRGRVDWILQIDNDEVLPHVGPLLSAIESAEQQELSAIEWPMRVLYRRTRTGRYLEVVDPGGPRYDYPGPIAVRPGVELVDARRCRGPFLRTVVRGDDRSLQVRHAVAEGEVRDERLAEGDAIVHNSWARSPASIRRKLSTWGHASPRTRLYYLTRWLPAPVTWPVMRDFHPFSRQLWPRLAPTPGAVGDLLLPEDR